MNLAILKEDSKYGLDFGKNTTERLKHSQILAEKDQYMIKGQPQANAPLFGGIWQPRGVRNKLWWL